MKVAPVVKSLGVPGTPSLRVRDFSRRGAGRARRGADAFAERARPPPVRAEPTNPHRCRLVHRPGPPDLGHTAFATVRAGSGVFFHLAAFSLEKEFTYPGEGRDLTADGHSLILTDGIDRIRFLDPATVNVTRAIAVTRDGQPLRLLNELELIRGEIYANIWQSNPSPTSPPPPA